ncbi:MAG: SUMF1/EgtB/PvdO family nonheme iron enzyme [Candidatus Pacebacteria bacterium]|nr:SUMF1/EgtB/PvdO family nonheme iron enzyme [Candidatus Paceibacterota bacterium]
MENINDNNDNKEKGIEVTDYKQPNEDKNAVELQSNIKPMAHKNKIIIIIFIALLLVAITVLINPVVINPVAVNPVDVVTPEAVVNSKTPTPVDDMILIPAGDFIMGSTDTEIDMAFAMCKEGEYPSGCSRANYELEYPSHTVFVDDYLIDKREVTNRDFNLFLILKNYRVSSSLDSPYEYENADNLPVSMITFKEAVDYCTWFNKRLPTEAEWEKAARGTNGIMWPWGSTWYPNKSNHGKSGETGKEHLDDSDGYLTSAPVDATPEDISPYGIINMSGNVVEFVSGVFKPYKENDKYNILEAGPNTILMKGGSYKEDKFNSRTTTRWNEVPNYFRSPVAGFRCAKDK